MRGGWYGRRGCSVPGPSQSAGNPALLRERVTLYRRVMPTVVVCQNLTAGYSGHYLHPGRERVFLVLVVELVMERGGAEGFKHQAKVRSCM